MKFVTYISGLSFTLLLFSMGAYGQDPVQYGTPFSGVPDPRDVSLYQVNIRCFSSSGNFAGVINRLDSIQALGVNVIYLMPIYPVGVLKSINSPYCISDLNAVGSEFGSLSELRNLVDSAHSKGMAVILDFVVNQTSWDNPWITEHPDWYQQNSQGQIIQLDDYSDVAAVNFANSTLCDTMIQVMRNWIFRANIDGYRCDDANNPPITFWQQAIASLRGITSHNLLLLAEGNNSNLYTAGFDFTYGWDFYYNSITQIYQSLTSPVTLIDNSNNVEYALASSSNQVARFLSNHDIYSSNGSPFVIFNGKDGVLAAFIVTTYMKSIPFIYNGMEVGNTSDLAFPFTGELINWTEDPTVTPVVKQIIAFRNQSFAIRRGDVFSYDNTDVCAFTKTSGNQFVFVASNLRETTKSFGLPGGIANTTMIDAFSKDSVKLSDTLVLSGYQYKVLTNGNVLPTDIQNAVQPKSSVEIYPNPVYNGYVTIQFNSLPSQAKMRLFNIQGVALLSSTLTYSLNIIDVSRLTQGIYFVEVTSNCGIYTQKLLIH